MAIKILTDSASDINQLEAEKMGIHLMPIPITFGETEYLDGVNLMPTEFYDKLESSQDLPVTSQITPFKYEETFEELTANGDQLIVITLSSKISKNIGSISVSPRSVAVSCDNPYIKPATNPA